MVRAAAVQLTGGDDVDANLKRTGELLTEAAADGCTLAVLPEIFPLMPRRSRDKARIAERPGDGPIQDFLRDAAARHDHNVHGRHCAFRTGVAIAPEPQPAA